jgi:hypothetical protein
MEPRELLGRVEACDVVKSVAKSNFESRRSTDHATFSFLVSAGHALSGKTRLGIETPRLVSELRGKLTSQRFASLVYLKVDFLNDCKFDATFDRDALPSVALGARLMYAFYGTLL